MTFQPQRGVDRPSSSRFSPEAAKAFNDLEPAIHDLLNLCWAAKVVAESGGDYENDLAALAVIADRAHTEANAILQVWRAQFERRAA